MVLIMGTKWLMEQWKLTGLLDNFQLLQHSGSCFARWLLLYYKYVLKLRLIGLLQQCTAEEKMAAVPYHTHSLNLAICNLLFRRWNWISREKYEIMFWKFCKIPSNHNPELWGGKKNLGYSSYATKLLVSKITPRQYYEVMTRNLVTYINLCSQWHSYSMSTAHLFIAQCTISSNSKYYSKVVYCLSITN
jgi:hypothetical protein